MKIRNARTIIGVVIFLTIILAMVSYVTLTGSLSILQVLLNGILMGGLYGLMAMGLALIFGIMKIINVCHGEFILLGAYVTFWLNYIFSVSHRSTNRQVSNEPKPKIWR
jgi:ABC-type branched-subunit amino acid transport system permease subunit